MKKRSVLDEMREEQSREFWGMIAFMAFIIGCIAIPVLFGPIVAIAAFVLLPVVLWLLAVLTDA